MTRRGWIIAASAAAVLVLLLILWGMRPGRQGQPGQPGQPAHDVKASAPALVLARDATSWPESAARLLLS